MVQSMTGWGDARLEESFALIKVEIKSVNNRGLDCGVKLPRAYLSAEEAIKSAVSKRCARGKIDIFVTIDTSMSDASMPKLNLPLAKAYADAAETLSAQTGISSEIRAVDILRMPDVFAMPKVEERSDEVTEALLKTVEAALESFCLSRQREGLNLKNDIKNKLAAIAALVDSVEERSPQSVAEYRKKLEIRLAESLAERSITVDEQRIVTEVAIFADKIAVNEEIVRLRSHLAEFDRTLERSEPIGRRLDFLVQECNREANTIGSKCNDAELALVVIDLKAEIEKIREQAANIE